MSSTASSTDSNAGHDEHTADSGELGPEFGVPKDVLDLDRAVEGDVGELLVHRGDDAARVRWRVEEVGIAERDVARTGGDELRDVGEHRVLVDAADAAVEHDRHRTVTAPVRAAVRREDRADELRFAVHLEPGVAIERRQEI